MQALALRLLMLAVSLLPCSQVQAQQFVRIGTGGVEGTYHLLGQALAKAVSEPGRVVASIQPTNGSVANVSGMVGGTLESGLVQADVASWAYQGAGIYQGKPAASGLRLIASLYTESVHVVVRKDSGIRSLAQLKGKRVALDEPGSGTLINARAILGAHGLKEAELRPEYIKPRLAAERLRQGVLDAFFFTAGTPAQAVADLAAAGPGIALLPMEGAPARALAAANPYFAPELIAANTYPGVGAMRTLGVGALWVCSEKLDAELVYQLTRALFSPQARQVLAAGHAQGRFITPQNALRTAGIPLHPGAARFYREAGLIK